MYAGCRRFDCRIGFGGTAVVSEGVKGGSVAWTHTITAIDDKGVTRQVEGAGAPQPGAKKGRPDREDLPQDTPSATAPPRRWA